MKLRNYLSDTKELISCAIPRGKTEKLLFITFEVLFITLGCFIALKSSVIDNPNIKWDIYFDFDNPHYLKKLFLIRDHGYYKVAHPLIGVILLPFEFICEVVLTVFGYKARTLVVIFFTSFAVSASILYVFKYLKNVICLNSFRSLLLAILFGVFANSIVLSFTPESYPFSMFLLTFTLYFFSINLKNKKTIPDSNIFILTLVTGGITITNALKVLIPILYFKNLTFIKRIKKYALHLGVFIIIVLVAYYILNIISGNQEQRIHFIARLKMYYLNFVGDENIRDIYRLSYVESVVNYFWGSPIIFAKFSAISLYSRVSSYPQLFILPYPFFWQYLIIGLLFILSCLSVILNFKSPLIRILILFFAVDIFIHLILKWGFYNTVIFGGHWTFLVPLFIGWLYFSIKSEEWKKSLDYLMIIIFIAVLGNNIFGMRNFIDFALTYYAI